MSNSNETLIGPNLLEGTDENVSCVEQRTVARPIHRPDGFAKKYVLSPQTRNLALNTRLPECEHALNDN
jgi:hypothetical protein